jgi:uncharacterized protein (DUF1800 family)
MRGPLHLLALSLLALPGLGQAQKSPGAAQNRAQKTPARPRPEASQPTLDPRERALQMLNRFTYGARPGDLERVLAIGPQAWFEQQLNPSTINDDALNRRLAPYLTLNLPPTKSLDIFPDRGTVQQVADGKRPMPTDPLGIAVFEVQLYKLAAEKEDRKNPPPEASDEEKAAKKTQDQATAVRIAGQLFALPKNQRMAFLLQQPVPDRIAFANNLPGDMRNQLNADFTPREREALLGMQGGIGSAYQIGSELAQAKVLRSILSERQLQEVMTDFWFNHFNIFLPKDSDQWYTTAYECDTIRPLALGKFRDLLLATAESPAMMVYLDNWLSIGPNSLANGVNPANPKSKPGNRGLNENYGREVMELHTVGVNAGYTQADVTHLAAILTGWSVDNPQTGGGFLYDMRKHEPGTKQWFGYTIDDQGRILSAAPGKPNALLPYPKATKPEVIHPAPGAPGYAYISTNVPPDGMKQGVTALNLLASQPQTARFISTLIAQRFLADEPPAAVIDRMCAAWSASDGDIKAVLRALVSSPEFNQKRFFRNKVKTPVEFLASAFRTTATDPQNPGALVNTLKDMGEPLYNALPPTGYYITADRWMNTAALVGRLNFADQLTHNKFANQKFDSSQVLAMGLMAQPSATLPMSLTSMPAPSASSRVVAISDKLPAPPAPVTGSGLALQVLERTLIGAEVSPRSEQFIRSQMLQALQQPNANPTDTLNLLTALILGSPDFQLR